MTSPERLTPSCIALAVLAACAPAWSQSDVAEGSLSLGLGGVSGDRHERTVFDQYNGLRPGSRAIGLAGGEYRRFDADSGRSFELNAADLLVGNREVGLRWKQPGDWKVNLELRELTRRETLLVNTGLAGAGTTMPQVRPLAGGAGTGTDLDLKVKRTGLGIELTRAFGDRWQLDASARSENREGARLWGIGMACPSVVAPGCRGTTGTETGSGLLFVPEPVHANHSQLETRLTYIGERLHLSAGYYGSFYRNDHGNVTPGVPAALFNPVGAMLPVSAGLQALLGQPVALPPDNQAHHLDVAGNYRLPRNTQVNFKLARSVATQHQDFAAAGFTGGPPGATDLGARLVTSLARVGLTSRPLPRLGLSGSLRYEHRTDHTPLAPYNIEGISTSTNRRYPRTDVHGKVQASYQFTPDWRGTLGAETQSIDRGEFTSTSALAGVTALRRKTQEDGLRAELRRRMTETLSGAITIEGSHRDGSNWLRDNSGTGVTEVADPDATGTGFATGIFSPTLADRQRRKVKLQADWQPTDELSLQLAAERGRDTFSSPSRYGLHRSGMQALSLDANYAINDKWSVNGHVAHGRQELDQSRPDVASMAFDNRSTTAGLGFTGKPATGWQVGGTLSFIHDRSRYLQTLEATAGGADAALLAASGGLPDTLFRQATLKLFGRYTLDKQSAVRLDLAHQRTRWTDWAWGYDGTPFVFSDGTTAGRRSRQGVSYVGITYIRKWP